MSKFAFRAVGSSDRGPQDAQRLSPKPATKPADQVIDVVATPVQSTNVAVAKTVAAPAPEAVTKPAAGAVVEYRGRPSYADDSENIRVQDITLPRINIVQKVGDLSNIFTPGDVVLNKETVLYKAPKTDPKTNGQIPQSKPLRIVVCGFRPDRWAEKTEGGDQGEIVDTVEQVVANGGTISYDEAAATAKTLYQQLAEALVLVEQPEDVTDPSFSYVADGKRWAPALWAMKGSAFTGGTKLFRTTRKAGWLKDEVDTATGAVTKKSAYFHGLWEMTTFCKAYRSGFFAWIPVPKRAAVSETGPEVRALAEKVLG